MSATSATFAMGCFWSPDARFGSTPGVLRTRVGYTGGTLADPTYKKLGDHTESVQIDFDPRRVSYRQLLDIFWTEHNPAKPVWGPQYMSAIFFHDTEQERLCMEVLQEQTMNGLFRLPTEIRALQRFYEAEAYHQKYYLRRQADLVRAISELHRSDEEFINSTVAARLNGIVAGIGEPAELEAELAALAVPARISQQIDSVVRKLREHGRPPLCD